jgi:hypothetical protein
MVVYMVEYAKSGRAKCNKCKAMITKDMVRIGKQAESSVDHTSCKWHHIRCFNPPRTLRSPSALSGFDDLSADEQREIEAQFQAGIDMHATNHSASQCYRLPMQRGCLI